jgi:molybdopterin molybdotransferase
VSTYVIFQVFARPALRRLMGGPDAVQPPVRGVLTGPVRQRPGRDAYLQSRARWNGTTFEVEIIPSSGSADFVACARGNALAIVPATVSAMAPGDPIDVVLLDDHQER